MDDLRVLVVFIVASGWGGALSVLYDMIRERQAEGGAIVAGAAFVGFAGAFVIRRFEAREC